MGKHPLSRFKYAETLYLYPDGHAVAVNKKRDKRAGEITWVSVFERLMPSFSVPHGRVIINREAIPMVLKSETFRVHESGGSEKTKEMGIKVHTFVMNYGGGETYLYTYPNLIIGDISWQTSANLETWEDVKTSREWACINIGEWFREE